jgi:hypothetical protein
LVDIFEMCINNVRRIATEKNFFVILSSNQVLHLFFISK